MDMIERRLKDYKGFQIWKVIDNKGMKNEKITILINDQEDNNCNCCANLKDAKKWIDEYTK